MYRKVLLLILVTLFVCSMVDLVQSKKLSYDEVVRDIISLTDQDRVYLDEYIHSTKQLLKLNQQSHQYHHSEESENKPFHKCIHDEIKVHIPPKINVHVNKNGKKQGLQAGQEHPMVILTNSSYLQTGAEDQTCYPGITSVFIGDYGATSQGSCDTYGAPCTYTCNSTTDVLTPQLSNLITNVIMPKVSTFFKTFLTVTGPTTTKIAYTTVSGSYSPCYNQRVLVSPAYQTTGFNGDMMYYVTAHPIPGGTTVAYAGACILDAVNVNRPLVGFVNFNPARFLPFVDSSKQIGYLWETYMRVALHEITHGLGFSNSLYSQYIDRSTGNTYAPLPYLNNTYTGYTPNGVSYSRTKYYLTTPTVKAFARSHFNCSSLPGAELENVGGSGTFGSHWKATVFGEEVMLGYSQPSAPYSNLTLALLYDSGWYGLINGSLSDQLVWGAQFGCAFTQTCNATTWNFSHYYPKSLATSYPSQCTSTRAAKGTFIFRNYGTDLLPYQQHFTNTKTGGIYFWKDYCPANEDIIVNSPNSIYCYDTTNNASSSIGEVYGSTSKCFEYTTGSVTNTLSLACWPQRCNSQGYLDIKINGVWTPCQPGTNVTVSALNVLCPVDYNVCLSQNIPSTSTSSTSSTSSTTATSSTTSTSNPTTTSSTTSTSSTTTATATSNPTTSTSSSSTSTATATSNPTTSTSNTTDVSLGTHLNPTQLIYSIVLLAITALIY